MEFRRVADAILRSQSTSRTISLVQKSTVRSSGNAQSSYTCCSRIPSSRQLSTTSRRHAPPPEPTTSAAPTATENKPATPKPSDPMAGLSNVLGWTSTKPRVASKSSMPFSNEALQRKLNGGFTSKELFRETAKINSASDLISALRNRREGTSAGTGSVDTGKMLDPLNAMSQTVTQTMVPRPERRKMKFGPTAGRTLHVSMSIDVTRAFRLLEQSCARNKVKRESIVQRFHERPGLKRKRLGRERWRKNFAEGFKATVGRVQQLKKQGW